MSAEEPSMMSSSSGPVTDTSRSPYAALHPVPVGAVQLHDGFWSPRLAINRQTTLPAQWRQCEETGRIDNFRRAAGKKKIDFQGLFFNDSDVYKWAEAAAFSLAAHPDPQLEADLDALIADIAAAQEPDGYLNTYFTFEHTPERFTNLKDMHEIYCTGHLIQAAVAHHRATGKTAFLEVAARLADCLDRTFGPEPGKRSGACGHEEAEMALVELYRETGEERYLKLAQFMIEARGRKPALFGNNAYYQDHLPFTEQTEMVGHAVRHLYLCCGATDVAAETDAPGYREALDNLWRNLTEKRMYVTGGAGSRWEGEAFGEDYELPNTRAYTETCAAIGSVMWNWRLLNLTGDPKFADLMELTLYNGVLAGLSLNGTRYFYQNPLADRGKRRRQEWFGCACCPPNIARLLASLPGYFYSAASDRENTVFVHLYASGVADIPLANGETVRLVQKTRYPWEGEVEFLVERAPTVPFTLALRIPAWAAGATVEWKGKAWMEPSETERQACIRGLSTGDVVRLTLPLDIKRMESHPHVLGNRGRIALQRGPLLYCIEQADHPDADVWDIALPERAELTPEYVPDLLDGVTVLRGQAVVEEREDGQDVLYRRRQAASTPTTRPVSLTAIPYYAWANRAAGPMQVWIPIASESR